MARELSELEGACTQFPGTNRATGPVTHLSGSSEHRSRDPSHFLCKQNSGDSKLTSLLVSFLNTPEKASTLSAIFFWTLSEWTCMSQLPSSFTGILLPTISRGKTQSSRMVLCTAVSVWLLGAFVYFPYGFLSWLGQTAPLSCKDNVFPTKPFLHFTSSPNLDFLGWFQLRNWPKKKIAFWPPRTLVFLPW